MRDRRKQITFINRLLLLLFVPLLLTGRSHAQSKNDSPASKEVYDRILALDASMFDAYNACDMDKVGTFFTEDLEFYHEKGGLTLTRKTTLDLMRTNLCGENSNKLRRELVNGSMKVYPINKYGAVQLGEHRFYITENGKEALSGVAKFIHVWKYERGEWRISRVFSYDHNAPGAESPATSGELYQTIASRDSGLFQAFNAHDIERLKTFFTKDLEFYHDKSGLTSYDQTNENFKKMFDQNNGIKRELIPNSLEVYPIKDYGVIEIGEHQFCHIENGKNDCGTFPFIIVWQNQGGDWKVSRVISYNH